MKSENSAKAFQLGAYKGDRMTSKKCDVKQKRQEEDEQTKQVFEDFVATFDETNKSRTWIKGGVVNPSSDLVEKSTDGSRIYKPVSKYEEKIDKSVNSSKDNVKKISEKPPALGKRRGQEQKKSKLEQFKEELKLIQKQRAQRHASKDLKNVSAKHSELDLSDVSKPRESIGSVLSMQFNSSSIGLMGSAPNLPSFYAKRNQRDKRDDYPYDYDEDCSTTNLFLGNLNPKMTEQELCETFGRYGPLASVKVMWPRTDEERVRGRNCGFVAFMNRRDGERALVNIRGKELMGFEMKLGWGKCVPIPLYPVYIPPALLELVKPPPSSGLPFNAQPRDWLKSIRMSIKERAKYVTDGDADATPPGPAPERKPFDIAKMSKDELHEVLQDAVVRVVIPSDRFMLSLIHRTIEFIILEGPAFEAAIMHRETNTPHFRFLFDYQSPEHTYYRWKLWSLLHGERIDKWKMDEFRMFEGGPLWRPPPVNLFTGGMPEELVEEDDYPYAQGYVPPVGTRRYDMDDFRDECRNESSAASRRTGLTEAQHGRFVQMLEDLEPSRQKIGDVMVWCLEHADSAADITKCILNSIVHCKTDDDDSDSKSVDSSSAGKKFTPSISKIIARLFLASDILYNSSAKVPNASYFRRCFESYLPDLFKHMHTHYRNAEGKLKAEQLKQKVMVCFRAWEDWAIYPNEFLIKLQNIFLGLVCASVDDESELEGVPLNLQEDAPDDDRTSSKVMESDVEMLQGQPLVQYDGDLLDVDGSPLDDETNIPNTSRSKPTSESKPVSLDKPKSGCLFVPSKWETVDPITVGSDAVTTTNRWELLVDSDERSTNQSSQNADDLNGMPIGVSKCGSMGQPTANGEDDADYDGQPLAGFSSLVAYDDEDVSSPVVSELNPPLPSAPYLPVNDPVLSPNGQSTTFSNSSGGSISEERRFLLREIELKVLKYQDELESSRRGDSSIKDQAIKQQIQRFRERLLERLNEDERDGLLVQKKASSTRKSRKSKDKVDSSSKHVRETISPDHRRNSRDRSPPRSFRDRSRHTHNSPDASSSPSSRPKLELTSSVNADVAEAIPFGPKLAHEDVEEGEASDDDYSLVAVGSSLMKRKKRDSHTPKSSHKRRRSTPTSVSQHSRHSHSSSAHKHSNKHSSGRSRHK